MIETFVNLAPIRDMTLIEADGQTHLVTASGNLKVFPIPSSLYVYIGLHITDHQKWNWNRRKGFRRIARNQGLVATVRVGLNYVFAGNIHFENQL